MCFFYFILLDYIEEALAGVGAGTDAEAVPFLAQQAPLEASPAHALPFTSPAQALPASGAELTNLAEATS